MAAFGKRNEGTGAHDDSDFVRIPPGTRLAVTDGKLSLAFAGDMSLGEALPELSELSCGRNLSIDPGVTIRAGVVRVKGTVEIEADAKLLAREIEVERLVSRKGHIEARTLTAGQVELESSRLQCDRVTARDTVVIDRGQMEIGAVVAQSLTITKGTTANILITEVLKLEGSITKGGFDNFADFLGRALRYHPEILNERFSAEARRSGPASPEAGSPTPEVTDDALAEPNLLARVTQEGDRLRALYQDKEMPKEVADFLGWIQRHQLEEVRRNLSAVYTRLAGPQGKAPEPVTEVFREIQRLLKEPSRARKEARPA